MLKDKDDELTRLFQEVAAGRTSAFTEVIRLLGEDVVNIAGCYLKDREEARDVAQEVFIKLYRNIASFKGRAKVSTWLYRIIMNASLDHLRRRKKTLPLDETVAVGDVSRDRPAVDAGRQRLIRQAVEKLPRRQKNVFILKHFESRSLEEISKILGCSLSSVKTHLYRAVEKMRQELKGKI